jgi:HlyD family secretion protein
MRESSSARELAAAKSMLKEAEAELAEFQPMAEGADTNRPPKELRSPVNGKILRVFEENARVVTPGLPLAEIGDPSDLEVVIEVLSRDGATILPGYKVELEQWGGGQPLEAKVRLVEPAAFTKVSALGVEEQRVNVIADMVTPPEQRQTVGDSFRVEARIIVWEAQNTLKVPSGALFRRGEEWGCYAVKDGRVHLRSVKIGRGSGTETQILQGLSEKEELVLYPGNRVHEGDRVKPITL